jgi:hypothetical protein
MIDEDHQQSEGTQNVDAGITFGRERRGHDQDSATVHTVCGSPLASVTEPLDIPYQRKSDQKQSTLNHFWVDPKMFRFEAGKQR